MNEVSVIEFHLDARSGVAPYLQLVHQVRQALRLGLLREGDQLPTVKDVVARLAINPNTVLKAYRRARARGPGRGPARRRHVRDRDAERRFARRARAAAPRPAALARARRAGPGSTTRASRPCSETPFASAAEEDVA